MKSLSSPYFLSCLQICSFFKLTCKPIEEEFPESIKLMNLEQLFANIVHSEYESALVKDIIIFLLKSVRNGLRGVQGAAQNYLIGGLSDFWGEVVERYYVKMAVSEFLAITEGEIKQGEYDRIQGFYQLDQKTKFDILSTLVDYSSAYVKDKIKINRETSKEHETTTPSPSSIPIKQTLLLGEYGTKLYFFSPCLSSHVIAIQPVQNKIEFLDKVDLIELIKSLLKGPQSTKNLLFLENLSNVQSKYMNEESPRRFMLIHRAKNSTQIHQMLKVQALKQKMLDINNRYAHYLTSWNNQCWGFLHHRNKYVELVKESKSIDHLIDALMYFLDNAQKWRKFKGTQEIQLPEQECEVQYESISRYSHLFIQNIKGILLNKAINIGSNASLSDLSSKFSRRSTVDYQAFFQIGVLLMEEAMQDLEEKQRKYLQKREKQMKRRKNNEEKLKNSRVSDTNENDAQQSLQQQPTRKLRTKARISNTSLSNSCSRKSQSLVKNKPTKTMQLRTRKSKKMFGVTMLDSDQEDTASKDSEIDSLKKYEFRNTRQHSLIQS